MTFTQDDNEIDWLKYQATIDGLVGELYINSILQIPESSNGNITIFKPNFIRTRTLDISVVGSISNNVIVDVWVE